MNGTHSPTDTGKTRVVAGIVEHGLTTLGQHIATHRLPTFAELQFADDLSCIEIHLSGCDAEKWWMSLRGCIDTVDITPAVPDSDVEWVTTTGRLPASGTRVQLRWVRMRRATAAA